MVSCKSYLVQTQYILLVAKVILILVVSLAGWFWYRKCLQACCSEFHGEDTISAQKVCQVDKDVCRHCKKEIVFTLYTCSLDVDSIVQHVDIICIVSLLQQYSVLKVPINPGKSCYRSYGLKKV